MLDGTADFTIADISVTSSRAEAFSFSMPWMNLGISILYVKPRAAPPSLLAFLDPFTTDVIIIIEIFHCFNTLHSGLCADIDHVCDHHTSHLCPCKVGIG